MLKHLSYSSIQKYLICGRNWQYHYLDGEKSPPNDNLTFGSAWHEMISLVCSGQSAKSAWTEAGSSKSLSGDLMELGGRMLTTTTHHITELRPKEVEYRFELAVPGVPIPIIGFIDMIEEDGTPIDFKTASRKWSQSQADSDLQSTFYLAAMNQAGMIELPATFRYMIFTKTKNPVCQIVEVERTAEDVFRLFNIIKMVWSAIEKEVFTPNPLTWKCSERYCEFWDLCKGGLNA